ncbi:protein of unknown function (plasmid) [Cupriavidus taiwanensis]|uniref:Uncharacterized protein n=1 Tax=Cupriavidus taiwanensis TaxID=164546 RepID=A0A375IP78_9BURK|nr:hypothetical protein CBM2629_B10424 [Cupriavidus taiwanensis]SPK76476.1 protein of unknown function [Cupriavidus taiwanensis]
MRWRGGGKGRRIHEVNGINRATYAIPRRFGDDQKKTAPKSGCRCGRAMAFNTRSSPSG